MPAIWSLDSPASGPALNPAAVSALLDAGPVDLAVANAVLDAVGGVSSDFEAGEVLRDLAARIETSDDWIVQRTGIRTTKAYFGPTPRPAKGSVKLFEPMYVLTYTTDQANRMIGRQHHYMLGTTLLAQLTDEWQHLNSALATLLGGTTEEQQ